MSDFAQELASIIAQLGAKDEWLLRLDGLRRLRHLLRSDISSLGVVAATEALSALRLPLVSQITDLRSQISREATGCAAVLVRDAVVEPLVAEAAVEWLLPPLLANTCSSIGVVAGAARGALLDIAATGAVNRAGLGVLLTHCTHRHSAVRGAAYATLLPLITTIDPALLVKQGTALHTALRRGFSDAVAATRRSARLCFWALEAGTPDEAALLYEGLEPAVQKAIDAEKAGYDAWLLGEGRNLARRAVSMTDPTARTQTAAPTTNHTALPSPAVKAINAILGEGDTDDPEPLPRMRGAAPQPLPYQADSAKVGSASHTSTGSDQGAAPTPRAASSPGTHPTSSSRSASLAGKRPPTSISISQQRINSLSQPRHAASGTTASAKLSSLGAGTSKEKKSSLAKPSARSATQQDAPETIKVSLEAPKEFIPGSRTDTGGACPADNPRMSVQERFKHILDGLSGAEWPSKTVALVELAQLVDLGMAAEAPSELITEIVPRLVALVTDQHYRVASSATATVSRLLERQPAAVTPCLDALLRNQLANLPSPHEALRDGSIIQLGRMLEVFGGSMMLSPVLAVLDTAQGATRLGTAEFLLHLVQTSRSIFTQQDNMRLALSRTYYHYTSELARGNISRGDGSAEDTLRAIQGLLSNKPTDVARALAAVMAALYVANREAFIAATLDFPRQEDINGIVAATEMHIPHLRQDLKRAKDGSRLLGHPLPDLLSPFSRRLKEATPRKKDREEQPCPEDHNGKGDAAAKLYYGESDAPARALEPALIEGDHPPKAGSRASNATNTGESSKKAPSSQTALSVSSTKMNSLPSRAQSAELKPRAGTRRSTQSPPSPMAATLKENDRYSRDSQSSKNYEAGKYDAANALNCDVGGQMLVAQSWLTRDDTSTDSALGRARPNRGIADVLAPEFARHPVITGLREARTREERHSAIMAAMTALDTSPKLWSARFRDLFEYAVAASIDASHTVRLLGLRWLTQIITTDYLRPLVAGTMVAPVRALLLALNDPFPEVQGEASLLLRALCRGETAEVAYPPDVLLAAILTTLEAEMPTDAERSSLPARSSAALSLRGTQRLLTETASLARHFGGTMTPARQALLQRLVPILLAGLGSSRSEVRKVAVISLADWLAAVGDCLLPHIQALDAAQLKLVSIFYNRRHADTRCPIDLQQLVMERAALTGL